MTNFTNDKLKDIFFAIYFICVNICSAWGDGIFLGIQTAIIAASVIFYGGDKIKALTFLVCYTAMMIVLTCGITPLSVLWTLQACNIPVVFFGKVSFFLYISCQLPIFQCLIENFILKMVQAYTNHKNGSTGQLSAITCAMLLFGSVARIFTSMQETGDFILILTYCIASFVNCLIVGQLIWYWNVQPVKYEKHSKKD